MTGARDDRPGRADPPADGKLIGPDGVAVPGGHYCRQHADAFIKEYREKLGETWTLAECGVDGRPL